MKRIEWMSELERNLSALDNAEREKVMSFYSELYNDKADSGMTEAEILKEFGNPAAVAKAIIDNNDGGFVPSKVQSSPEKPAAPESQPYTAGYSENMRGKATAAAKPKKKRVFLKIVLPIILGVVLSFILAQGICTIVDVSTIEEKSFDGVGGYSRLNLEIAAADVYVSRGDEFKLEYKESVFNKVKIQEGVNDPNCLYVKQRHNSWSWGCSDIRINITLPELAILDVQLSAGNLTVKDFNLERLNLDISAGNVNISNCTAEQIITEVSAGNVKLDNCSTERLKSEISAGNISMTDVTANNCELNVSAGNIKLNELDVRDMKIGLSAGSVNGSIAGKESDFSVDVNISAGKSNLKTTIRENAEKRITAEISAGNLNLTFSEI